MSPRPEKHRGKGIASRPWQVSAIALLALTLCAAAARAEDPETPPPAKNPFGVFGNVGQNGDPQGQNQFGDEDNFDLEDDFGFQPPPPDLPGPEGDHLPADPPPARAAQPQRLTSPPPSEPPPPPPARARRVTPPAPPRNTNRPPPRLAAPPVTTPTPSAPPAVAESGSSKLAGYLELDPAVKGLQVQNFDMQDQDIRNVVKLISKWTGKNFILDQKVRGKITILGPSQVTLQEAYQAFLSALAANNLTTVQSGKFIRIIESAEARRAPVKTYVGDYAPNTDQFITRIFQLNYINADEVQREFRDMTTRQGKLFAYEPTNSVIITDTGSNIQRIKDILDSLDIPSFEATLHVIQIKHNSSKKIADLLDEIYGAAGGAAAGRSGSANRRSFRRSQLERTRGGGVITRIVPDEQTNSLVVLANDRGFRQLKELVNKLDTKATDTGRVHVYYCEYAKAEDLAATLAALSTGGSGGARPQTSSRRSRSGSTGTTPGGSNARTSTARSGPISAELDGGVRITSDSSTNALVITANAGDYQALKRVIKKLDIPRLQVFVESAIMELTLDDSTNVGLNYAFGHPERLFGGGFIGDASALTNLLTNGAPPEGATIPFLRGNRFGNVPFNVGGVSGTTVTQGFMGILNLLTSTTEASVLSTPQIIALDNEEAVFKVQDEIPVVGSSTTSTTAGNTQNIDRLKAGIEVKLTPFINAASGTIRMDIEQTVDSLKSANDVPANLRDTQRAKTTRETNTSVVVKDKDYVVLGGLMTDQVEEVAKKVPLLGDIPVLGWLFKSQSFRKAKKNLVVLLHPKIIGTTLDSAMLTEDKLDGRDRFIDEHFGNDETHPEELDRIRSGLEDQKKRGKSSKQYNYRNNADDAVDADEKVQQRVTAPEKAPARERERVEPEGAETNDEDLEKLLSDEESALQGTLLPPPRQGQQPPPGGKTAPKSPQDAPIEPVEPGGIEPVPPDEGDFVTTPPNDPFFPGNPPVGGPAGPEAGASDFLIEDN